MSLSQLVKPENGDAADLRKLDLLFALLLHVLVFTAISILAYWQQQHHYEPLKRVEVMMISARELAKLQQQAHTLPLPKRKTGQSKPKAAKIKPALKPKPAPKSSPVARPKTRIKPAAKAAPRAKSHPVSKPKTKTAARVEDDFDPFAPVASTSDRKGAPAVAEKETQMTQQEQADVAGTQLSEKEQDRYIALMQAAVQHQWRVPASPGDVVDPLVEMRLSSNGQIESISILESSGSAALDATLISAIKRAAPFQLPARQFEFFRVNRMRFHPLK